MSSKKISPKRSRKKAIEEILALLVEHSRIIYNVLSNMGVYYTSWMEENNSNQEELSKKKAKLQILEEDADAIKLKLISQFSEAETQGLGDYMTLILKMDNAINPALEFVDILSKIESFNQIDEEMKGKYEKLINSILKMGNVLKLAIKNLRGNLEEVCENTTTIHEIENEIDLIFREFLDYLYDNEEIKRGLLFRLRDSVKILEELADRIHDIGDLIRVIRHS
ncbi:MAG: DUF47 family protein [Promethearchaeota archaeon]|nr:MAG: DUF47 family protein [Candidatus Lokiarchaeota archaeon]